MPKILSCSRDTMLAIARKQFLTDGYEGFTIRDVAKECGVSVGTIYSYFSSKEALLTQAMVEEWRGLIREIREKMPAMETPEAKLEYLYESIFRFNGKYRGFCVRTLQSKKDQREYEKRRETQWEQVSGIVALILPQVQKTEGLAAFIADLFLSNCNRGVFPYEKIAPFVRKLYA